MRVGGSGVDPSIGGSPRIRRTLLGTGRMRSRTLTALIPGLPSDTRGGPLRPGPTPLPPTLIPWTSVDLRGPPRTSALNTLDTLFSVLFFFMVLACFWRRFGSLFGSIFRTFGIKIQVGFRRAIFYGFLLILGSILPSLFIPKSIPGALGRENVDLRF